MKSLLFLFCSSILLFMGLDQAVGYTGGPALVEVLGWEPGERRVYVYELPIGESGAFGVVSYMQVDSTTTEKTRVSWSRADARENDPEQARKLEELRKRLEGLPVHPWSTLPNESPGVSPLDSVDTAYGRRPAFGLSAHYWALGATFECTTYTREFLVKDVYRIPETKARLYVVVFKGNPYDGMLPETQVPVVVVPTFAKTQKVLVTWRYPR